MNQVTKYICLAIAAIGLGHSLKTGVEAVRKLNDFQTKASQNSDYAEATRFARFNERLNQVKEQLNYTHMSGGRSPRSRATSSDAGFVTYPYLPQVKKELVQIANELGDLGEMDDNLRYLGEFLPPHKKTLYDGAWSTSAFASEIKDIEKEQTKLSALVNQHMSNVPQDLINQRDSNGNKLMVSIFAGLASLALGLYSALKKEKKVQTE